MVEPLGDRFDRHRAHARRGELDGERDAVQAPADACHRQRLAVDAKVRRRRRRAIREQPHRLVLRQDRHGIGGLARDAQRLARGGNQLRARRRLQELSCELGAGLQQVLAVVENDEDLALT